MLARTSSETHLIFHSLLSSMHFRLSARNSLKLSILLMIAFSTSSVFGEESSRMTPLVKAVAHCSPSVVNLRGRKTVSDDKTSDHNGTSNVKQVNGMGTGVVIDSRGYVLTNYHVVQGVKRIEVSTSNRIKTTGKLVAHDPVTDLAILKIETVEPLPVIKIGASNDLMLAETVAAVGNAYGYEHTVTVGIISQLGRTVQVNEEQIYKNLIQTDAPINPGNSGGPLLNLEGEMIGINVAVRIGAQGIAFAIPVNDAMDVAANLMNQLVPEEVFHGINARTAYIDNQPRLMVDSVDPSSPAANIGMSKGDQIVSSNGQAANLELDLYRSLLSTAPKSLIELVVTNQGSRRNLSLRLAENANQPNDLPWRTLGIRLGTVEKHEMEGLHPNYTRGLRVTRVKAGSAADKEGIMSGDILVAMHGWKTETLENLAYILDQKDVKENKEFMFYILRDKEPFWGQMRIAKRQSP